MTLLDAVVEPDLLQVLVDLHFVEILAGRQAKAVAGPNGDAASAALGRQELVEYARAVFGLGGCPDHGVDHGVFWWAEDEREEVFEEGTLDEFGAVLGVAVAVQECAVKIHDDKQRLWVGEFGGWLVGYPEVCVTGYWNSFGHTRWCVS